MAKKHLMIENSAVNGVYYFIDLTNTHSGYLSCGFSSTAEKNGNCFETEFNMLTKL